MTRQEIYKEIEGMFGVVPGFLKSIPEPRLEPEWRLVKDVLFAEGPIPSKSRALTGLSIAAVTHCRYSTLLFTEMAKVNGASDAEVEDAVHIATGCRGLSIYLNGLQSDIDAFRKDVSKAVDHVRSLKARGKAA